LPLSLFGALFLTAFPVFCGSQELLVDTVSILMWAVAIVGGLFAAYLVLHYVLFLLMAHPKDAGDYGIGLNEFERRQLVEWAPRQKDFLKHDDEDRTYDDVFGTYRDIDMNYSTCVFPRAPFSNDNEVENLLLEPKEGMRILELGCGAGATAHDFASRHNVKIVCVTNSTVQTEICRKKFAKFGGRVSVITTDFDKLDLPAESFDAIYAFESIGYDVAPNFYPVALESGVRLCPVGRWWRRSAERSRRRSAA
jgi:hypothetical protein